MTLPAKACVIDGKLFTPQRSTDQTCSTDCSIQLRRQRSRESTARRYVPRPRRPDSTCQGCGASIPAPKSGPLRKWCGTCKASGEAARAAERIAVRRCYKCNVEVPDAERKPGKAVCGDCRVDPRQRGADYEQRRRLRRYGITQEQYDAMFERQGGRCPGCGTTEPGAKGWCVDHDHACCPGKWSCGYCVRGLICNDCNTVLGYVHDEPQTLQSLADYLRRTLIKTKI